MAYLVLQILLCLFLAALLGGIIGWLWKSIFCKRLIDEAESRAALLHGDLERANATLGATRQELATTQDHLSAAQSSLDERDAELASRNGFIAQLESKLGEQEASHREATAAAAAALAAAQKELQELTARHDQLQTESAGEAETLRAQLTAAESGFKDSLATAEKQHAEALAAAETGHREALAACRSQLEGRGVELNTANSRVADLEAQLDAIRTSRQESEQRWRDQLAAAEQAGADATARASASDGRIQALVADLDSRDQKLVGYEQQLGQLESARARITQLEGQLAGHAESEAGWRDRLHRCQTMNQEKEDRIAELEERLAAPVPTPVPAPARFVMPTAAEAAAAAERGERPDEIDDLKMIYGVGPVLEEMLHGLGIFTFRQVAHWTQEDIEWVESKLDAFNGRIERDNWRAGARKEHREKYGEEA